MEVFRGWSWLMPLIVKWRKVSHQHKEGFWQERWRPRLDLNMWSVWLSASRNNSSRIWRYSSVMTSPSPEWPLRTCSSCTSSKPCSITMNLTTVSAHMKRSAARLIKVSRAIFLGQSATARQPISAKCPAKNRLVSTFILAPVGSLICLTLEWRI